MSFDPTVPENALQAAHTAVALGMRQFRIALAYLDGVDPEEQRALFAVHAEAGQVLNRLRGQCSADLIEHCKSLYPVTARQ